MRKLSGDRIDIDEGWAVHVYASDRRLLCSFNPSHFWLFLIGLAVGGLLTASWMKCAPSSSPTSFSAPSQAPLAVD